VLPWAHRGLLPHAGIGQHGLFPCHGSAVADPRGGQDANTRSWRRRPRTRTRRGGKRRQSRDGCAHAGKGSVLGARDIRPRHHHLPSARGERGSHRHPRWRADPFPSQRCQPLQWRGQGKGPLSPRTSSSVGPRLAPSPRILPPCPAPGSGCHHMCEGTSSTSGIAAADHTWISGSVQPPRGHSWASAT